MVQTLDHAGVLSRFPLILGVLLLILLLAGGLSVQQEPGNDIAAIEALTDGAEPDEEDGCMLLLAGGGAIWHRSGVVLTLREGIAWSGTDGSAASSRAPPISLKF